MSELNPAQKRKEKMNNFSRKYGQHWLVYLSLLFTAMLSFVSGLILPFIDKDLTVGGLLAAIYYSIGFVTNGEAASNYWFGKLTDHDKDNTPQKVIASLMLTLSVVVSLTTALAAAAQIAYLLGVLTEFRAIPAWAQEWIVWSIPIFWVVNSVSGMAFKAISDESAAERDANSVISAAKQEITRARVDARAKYWKDNAAGIAKQMGEMEAQKEIEDYSIRLQLKPTRQFSSDTVNPTPPPTLPK